MELKELSVTSYEMPSCVYVKTREGSCDSNGKIDSNKNKDGLCRGR